MTFLKRLLTCILLTTGCIFAQVDIKVGSVINPYVILATGVPWGSSGNGGANNYYIFQPITSDMRSCLYIKNNNPSSAHSVTVAVWQTGDTTQTSFNNNSSGSWVQDALSPAITSVAASTTVASFIQSNAAAYIAVSITGATTQAGSPDTMSAWVVQTTGSQCGTTPLGVGSNLIIASQVAVPPVVIGGPNTNGIANTAFMGWSTSGSAVPTLSQPLATIPFSVTGQGTYRNFINCDGTGLPSIATQGVFQINVTAASTTQIVASGGGLTKVFVCGFTVSMSAAGTAQFVYGTGTNCGTGTTAITPAMPLATATPWTVFPGEGGTAFVLPANTALCVAAVTGNVVGYLKAIVVQL